MTKLQKIHISGFRGVRYDLPIEFGKSCESMAIFGENAAGKSTITDAVEWFFTDRVDHLWKEDCKEEALRNVHLAEEDTATVSLQFSNDALSCTKSINKALNAKNSNISVEFNAYRAKSSLERIVLRTFDLIHFVDKSKGDKRKEVADIIGYEALVAFRDLVQKAESTLQKEGDYIHAKKSQDDVKAKIIKLSGGLLSNENELFHKATQIAQPFLGNITDLPPENYTIG